MPPRILVLADYFPPGHQGGGCQRAVWQVVEAFQDEWALTVVTRDRDGGMAQAYTAAARADLEAQVRGRIHYLPPGLAGARRMRDLLRGTPWDLVYANSFFSPWYSLLPLVAGWGGKAPILLAPRGELLAAALQVHGLRKRALLALAKHLPSHRQITYQATSPEEAAAIHRWMGKGAKVRQAPDLPGRAAPGPRPMPEKRPGMLRLLFLGRIHPHKGLHRLLGLLPDVPGDLQLRVAGPVANTGELARCRSLAAALPPRIQVEWLGPLNHAEALRAYGEAHIYVLPTASENHGYTIFEALQAGRPVLTGRDTPWKDLENWGAGAALDIHDSQAWVDRLTELVGAGSERIQAMGAAAFEAAQLHTAASGAEGALRDLVLSLVHGADIG